MTSVLCSVVLLLVVGCSYTTADTCQSRLPSGIDSSICNEIQSVFLSLRYAVRDIDKKVKETVVVALKEARDILDSTSATTIKDIKDILAGSRRKRSAYDGLPSEVYTVAEKAVVGIEKAIGVAEKKIRSSIALAVSTVQIENDKLKIEAVRLLHKILTKRSMPALRSIITRRDIHSEIQKALAAAADEVQKAMKEAVTTSIQEYRTIMDYFAPNLKELFKKANLDGNVDQAEEDIEQLAIKSSEGFLKFYDSFSQVAVAKAIKSVEGLMAKIESIGKTNPSALPILKGFLQNVSQEISVIVVDTTKEPDEEIRATVFKAAEKMFKDYQTVETLINKSK